MAALHIFAGKRYITGSGRVLTVIRKYREAGSKTRMVWMVEIKWEGEEGTNKITRRMFNKIVSDYFRGQKPEPQPQPETALGLFTVMSQMTTSAFRMSWNMS